MKLTVTTLNDVIVTLEVSPDMEIENFKALCECEVGVPAHDMVILHEGNPLLDNTKDLASYGIREGDVVLVQPMHRPDSGNPLPDLGIDFGAIQVPGNLASPNLTQPSNLPPIAAARPPTLSTRDKDKETAEQVRQTLMNSPDRLAMLKQNNPALADAYLSGDNEKFEEVLSQQLADKAERQRQRIAMLNASPFDIEYQKRIAEEIRQENVDSNMEAAMEYHPESFGQVTMLYIHCRVNGHPVRAFIDSGAQTTIMSQACAERCGIMRLVDKRWSGYAKGVGVQKIIGRVHLGHIQINDVFLQSSFSILEDQVMDMLLGLDMLKRHQCCIDLKRNILVIGTTGAETSFLSEGELADLKEFEPNQSVPGPSK